MKGEIVKTFLGNKGKTQKSKRNVRVSCKSKMGREKGKEVKEGKVEE
jgi:hypothetical protein